MAAIVQLPHEKNPLKFLDLPIDVLELVVDEVTYTDDLIALALTNSALYSLAISRIYSGFEIIWPEDCSSHDTYDGVDALTYGLSTLVTAGGANLAKNSCCVEAPIGTACIERGNSRSRARRANNPSRRRSHNLAQYVRRFSIANGPSEIVEDHFVSTDSGKMLGTLVALAVARMPRLETFEWDMPTGVSREVWEALSSLGDLDDSRLEKILMRCPESLLINGGRNENLRRTTNAMNAARDNPRKKSKRSKKPANYMELSYSHIQSPSLSLLPPMKSIAIIDVDEPAYLQELSVAVATSVDTLRELRIGVASLLPGLDWATADRVEVYAEKSTDASLGFLSNGGVLGLVMKEIYDCRPGPNPGIFPGLQDISMDQHARASSDLPNLDSVIRNARASSHEADDGTGSADDDDESSHTDRKNSVQDQNSKKLDTRNPEQHQDFTKLDRKRLRLETLELGCFTIRAKVLRHSIQWEVLTSLTLLNCRSDERLWKLLTSIYSPIPIPDAAGVTQGKGPPTARKASERNYNRWPASSAKDYCLNLKKVHTNRVSFALIIFLRKALAPNSLEQLFFQETYPPPSAKVPIEEIYHGPVRYHRLSLKKLMIDSVHSRDSSGTPGPDTDGEQGSRWALNRRILSFITSGRMPELRELAVVIDYKDWHFLLQGLPRIPHLRALYLPYILNRPYGLGKRSALEMSKQVVDVATLRPEMELVYLAIWQQCYEILENNGDPLVIAGKVKDDAGDQTHAGDASDEDDEYSDDDEGHEHSDDEEDENDGNSTFTMSESSLSGGDGGDLMSRSQNAKIVVNRLKLKLRKISFCDDKVSVFKARDGRL